MTAARLRRARNRLRFRGALAVAGWAIAFLVGIDVAMNVVYHRPASATTKPEGFRGYLDYGRSTEGKLAYMVRATDAESAPLVPIGWVEHGVRTPNVLGPAAGGAPRVRVAAFGMSFSNHISGVLSELDLTAQVTQYAGPSAPPNHSFALYRAYRRLGREAPKSDVVVWGILASSVKGMVTMTGMTWNFEAPPPFCYPRYTLDGAGKLVETWPSITTEADLRVAVADPARMGAFRASLAAGDRFYNGFDFRASPFDRSALARMVHRAIADRHVGAVGAKLETKDGFADDPDVGPPLRAMCREFAATARADGRYPILLLIQDQGSADHLYKLLGPSLAADGVPFLSTHEIVRTSDKSNFISDGHFTHEAYVRVAVELRKMIDARR